jgi:hypothetical protein
MKANQLLAGSILDPKQLQVLHTAFEAAWVIIRPTVGRHPMDQELARLKLANLLLSVEKSGPLDAVRLRNQALWRYRMATDRRVAK